MAYAAALLRQVLVAGRILFHENVPPVDLVVGVVGLESGARLGANGAPQLTCADGTVLQVLPAPPPIRLQHATFDRARRVLDDHLAHAGLPLRHGGAPGQQHPLVPGHPAVRGAVVPQVAAGRLELDPAQFRLVAFRQRNSMFAACPPDSIFQEKNSR